MATQERRFSNGMNPKTPADLDPKLKEAYDRVMGGNFSQPIPTAPTNPTPKIEPVPAPTAINPPPLPPLTNPMSVNMPPLNVMSPSSAPVTAQPANSAKKKSKISPIIFLVVGLAFFAVYAVVWAKVFKLF